MNYVRYHCNLKLINKPLLEIFWEDKNVFPISGGGDPYMF